MTYYDFVKDYMKVDECKKNKKYSSAGHTFCWNKNDSNYADGLYWFYEGDEFIIDVHDFYIREEVVQNNTYSMADYVSIYSSYIVSASGERFSPYQTLSANSLCTLDFDNIKDDFVFLLHENSYYLTVSIGFKRELLEKHLLSINIDPESFYRALLQINQIILTKALEKVAMEILNCKMEAPAADFFFKAKSNEWVSIVIDTYLNRKKYKIESDDNKALDDVARFLDYHFAMNVNQGTLEKISKMSGTKLKNLFKEKYGQSITEYTQRKRMNVAETLLLNTELPIKEIAESVGYTSHSKFSIYYKRYKGKLPSEVRNLTSEHHKLKCDCCD